MQLPVFGTIAKYGTDGQADAWNWLQNTSDGVALFQTGFGGGNSSKLQIAYNFANQLYEQYPGIPSLTSCQLEEMAIELYGSNPGKGSSAQYYSPACVNGKGSSCAGGQCQWQINDGGNFCGVCYVAAVRAAVPPSGPPSMATSCTSTDPPSPTSTYRNTTFMDACKKKKCVVP